MTTKYFALLTNQGAAKLANATALGTKVQITQMGVGDGGGTLPTPTGTQTTLVNEKRRDLLNTLNVDAANSSQIIAEQIIPENEGGFWIREIGLYDSDNTLIAVANCPETYKPLLAEGSGRTQTVRMILIINSTDAVTLKIDPAVVLATRQYVDDKVIEVKAYTDEAVANMLAGVVGESRNAKMSVTAASATATFTADELIVQTALGGRQYKLASVSKTVNLISVGAGGMDTGTAPVNGFIALYVIFNPATKASTMLAVNATLAVVPEVYGGTNMPAGFTASALVSVWPTIANGQFRIGCQDGRKVANPPTILISTSGVGTLNTLSAFNATSGIPKNAKEAFVTTSITNNNANGGAYSSVTIATDSAGSGSSAVGGYSASSIGSEASFVIPVITAQTLYSVPYVTAGTAAYNVSVSAYTF